MPRVRVHQHVNPLTPYFKQEPEPFDLSAFADPSRPLHIDLGCARGRFLLRMAAEQPDWNYLGVEIREPLVTEANRLGVEAGLTNLRYEFCNAMLWLEKLLESIPEGVLQVVTIQFPDPWFKKKHAKRRMVNQEMVEVVARHLTTGGIAFVQTDIELLGDEMFTLFRDHGAFTETVVDDNPFPIKTEREKAVEDKNLPVYRRVFTRKEAEARA
jgi:tRNA (guanine-N7-)-methyltransferase